jgi:hypothetical protein
VRPHDLDVVSLLAGLVFLVLGAVGVLQGAEVIDSGTPWALIGAIAAVGLTGVVVSLRRLTSAPTDGPPTGETPLDETPLDDAVDEGDGASVD